MTCSVLEAERAHLAGMLEAIQRCVYFLNASGRKYAWPLTPEYFEHFNSLHALIPNLYGNAARFLDYCQEALGVLPAHGDFADEFTAIVRAKLTFLRSTD